MPWRGPQYRGEYPSLGYQVLGWIEDNLVIPDGERAGQPFIPTEEQAVFAIRQYRLQPKTCRLKYRGAQMVRPKGAGKSPFAAALTWAEAVGPVRPDGWDSNGEPVGRPVATPWCQIAAVAEDQTDNTWLAVLALAVDAPLAWNYPQIDIGITRINTGSGRIEYVTSRAGTREGQRTTFAVLDETHLWLPHNGGTKLASTIRRNVAKQNGLTLETTNMYAPGEQSVAEATHTAKQADILIDTGREAPHVPDLSRKRELRKALKVAYGDAHQFVDFDRLIAEINDPRVPPNEARRFYLNQRVTGEDAWMDPDTWNRLETHPETLDGPFTVGFSGARYSDALAIVGCDIPTGHLFTVGMWEDSGKDGWEAPTGDIEASVTQLFESRTVARMYANPMQGIWDSYIDGWIAEHGKRTVIRWPIIREAPWAYAIASFTAAVRAGDVSHDGSGSRHVLNAHTRSAKRAKNGEGRPLHLIERPHPDRSIAWAQAAVLAYEARGDAIAAGAKKRKRAHGF